MRVCIKLDDPLLMGFLLKLDDDTCVWVQIKYERVCRLCFSCECIGHKADHGNWTHEQIVAAIRRQMRRIRNTFDVNIGVNFFKMHFVNSACAFADHLKRRTTIIRFADHLKRRTTIIRLIAEDGQLFYHPADISQGYINEDPDLAFHIYDDSSQSLQ